MQKHLDCAVGPQKSVGGEGLPSSTRVTPKSHLCSVNLWVTVNLQEGTGDLR